MEYLFDADNSEDILAKYRTKPLNNANNTTLAPTHRPSTVDATVQFDQDANEETNKRSETLVFENVHKKLRFVLSNAEIQQLPYCCSDLRNLVRVLFSFASTFPYYYPKIEKKFLRNLWKISPNKRFCEISKFSGNN